MSEYKDNSSIVFEKAANLLKEVMTERQWYKGTSIERRQAAMLKTRIKSGKLSLGLILEILIEIGYEIEIKPAVKHK